MKYSLLIAALLTLFLVGCGEPKPGQYPPSFMDERESAPSKDSKWGIGLFLKVKDIISNNRLLQGGCFLKIENHHQVVQLVLIYRIFLNNTLRLFNYLF